jgi:hypothetical protein
MLSRRTPVQRRNSIIFHLKKKKKKIGQKSNLKEESVLPATRIFDSWSGLRLQLDILYSFIQAFRFGGRHLPTQTNGKKAFCFYIIYINIQNTFQYSFILSYSSLFPNNRQVFFSFYESKLVSDPPALAPS